MVLEKFSVVKSVVLFLVLTCYPLLSNCIHCRSLLKSIPLTRRIYSHKSMQAYSETGAHSSDAGRTAPETLYRQYLASEFGVVDGTSTAYESYNPFIVNEFIEYRPRNRENEVVVELFRQRQQFRTQREVVAASKPVKEPLVVIQAAQGGGKSTFLVHFPLSACYQEYCGHVPPIVAPFTFNGAMSVCLKSSITHRSDPTIGLRMLFGAAMAMRSTDSKQLSSRDGRIQWSKFMGLFETFASLSAEDALIILRSVYGDRRPVLVMVDKLSRMTRDEAEQAVLDEIEAISSRHSDVDVIVSSQYTEVCLTRCQNHIKYVVFDNLSKHRLGHEKCADWANRLLSQLEKSEIEVDKQAIRFLQSIDLLLSGHPQALNFLISSFEEYYREAWENTSERIRGIRANEKLFLPDLMSSVIRDLTYYNSHVAQDLRISRDPSKNSRCLEEALSFEASDPDSYRELLVQGSVYLIPESKFVNNCRTTMSLLSFLTAVISIELRTTKTLDPAVHAAVTLFDDISHCHFTRVEQLLERAVALTVVCYSLVSEPSVLRPGAWLGCPLYLINRLPLKPPKLTTRIARTVENMMIPAGGPRTNELVVAFDNCPGFDSVVTLMATEDSPAQTIYLEQKVSAVKNPEAMRVSKIVSVLQFHYLTTRAMTKNAQLDSFKHMHVLFYEWGADPADVTISKAAVTAAVSSYFSELERKPVSQAADIKESLALKKSVFTRPKGLQYDALVLGLSESKAHLRHMRDCFDAYLSAEGDEDTVRACVIGRADLEEWLVPPMAPIPLLVESVLSDEMALLGMK